MRKFKCIKSYYWNLTSPYWRFEEGEYYTVIESENCFLFTVCDWIIDKKDAGEFFVSPEDWREERIDKILENVKEG